MGDSPMGLRVMDWVSDHVLPWLLVAFALLGTLLVLALLALTCVAVTRELLR